MPDTTFIRDRLDAVIDEFSVSGSISGSQPDLQLINNEIRKEVVRLSEIEFNDLEMLTPEDFNMEVVGNTLEFFDRLDALYTDNFDQANRQKENIINYWIQQNPDQYRYMRDAYYNESLSDIVKKVFEKIRSLNTVTN